MEVPMLRLSQVSVTLIGLAGLLGCRDDRSNPLASNTWNPSFDRQREQDEEGAGFLPLVAVFGPGKSHIRAVRIPHPTDRKSTRLNSSHSQISYAVFCLKKKKTTYTRSCLLNDHTAAPPRSRAHAL